MFQRTHSRRPGAIAALATLALFVVTTPTMAGGPDRGARSHRDHDAAALLRGVVDTLVCSIDGCGHDHAGGIGVARHVGDRLGVRHGRGGRDLHRGRGVVRSGPRAGAHAVFDGRCHTWVSGHWTVTHERICIAPARTQRIWVDPVHRIRRDACGRAYRVVVRAGYWDTITIPARYETRARRVWNEGRWQACGATCGHGRGDRVHAARGADRGRRHG